MATSAPCMVHDKLARLPKVPKGTIRPRIHYCTCGFKRPKPADRVVPLNKL